MANEVAKTSVMSNQRHAVINAGLGDQGIGGFGFMALCFYKPPQISSTLPKTLLYFQ